MSEPLTRRALLRAGAGAGLALGLPGVLAACGTTVHVHGNRTGYVINANGTSPPLADLARLMAARARATGMAPILTTAAGVTLPADLRLETRLGAYDPRTNRSPAVNELVVVGVLEPALVEPIAATALHRGVQVVSYPVALEHGTAGVLVDAAAGATALATHAAAWARAHLSGHGHALLVLAPSDQAAVNPYASKGATVQSAVRRVLARQAPGLALSTTTGAYPAGGRQAVARGLAAHPDLDVVLVWDDDAALGAAQALRAHHASSDRRRLYVGALGAPAVTSRATFDELRRDDVLRAVVAARPRDLANALVDLPRALLNHARGHDVTLGLHTLTPRSPALAAYSSDYALHPPDTNYADTQLNPAALQSSR